MPSLMGASLTAVTDIWRRLDGQMPRLQAGPAGFAAGFALLIGSVPAWGVNISTKVVAGIMAFGAGVLISTLSLKLVEGC